MPFRVKEGPKQYVSAYVLRVLDGKIKRCRMWEHHKYQRSYAEL